MFKHGALLACSLILGCHVEERIASVETEPQLDEAGPTVLEARREAPPLTEAVTRLRTATLFTAGPRYDLGDWQRATGGEPTDPTEPVDPPAATVDAFGIRTLYSDAAVSRSWSSAHWATGTARTVDAVDANDPSGWSRKRGTGTLSIDGQGVLTMSGSQPRIYINPGIDQGFRNVEVTMYYRRVADDGIAYAGAVIGTRSGADGHVGDANCDASTYYGRLRNDGAMDFEKELSHPASATRSRQSIWDGATLPHGQWIGMKLVVQNLPGDSSVRLRLYRDLTEGRDGGDWVLLGESIDEGGWAPPHACGFAADRIITDGGGVVFIRNTSVAQAEYKWVSVREIEPASGLGS